MLSEKFQKNLLKLDFYRKLPKDLTQPTTSGAVISVIALFCMSLLFLTQLSKYLQVTISTDMFVDINRGGQKLQINLDIQFPKFPCALLSLQAQDVMSSRSIDLKGKLTKFRLSPTGEKIQQQDLLSRKRLKDPQIAQQLQNKQGCRISGFLLVNKVPGNFRVSSQSFQHSLKGILGKEFNSLDLSHTVHSLSFGNNTQIQEIKQYFSQGVLNPLDNTYKQRPENSKQPTNFEYYIKVVPTTYKTLQKKQYYVHQFTYNTNQYKSQNMPAIFFKYDLSPVTVKFSQTKEGFFHFLVQLCAIVGGVFTVAGLLDNLLHSSISKILKGKTGKLGQQMESQTPYKPLKRSWCDRTFSKLSPGSLRSSIFTLCSSTIGAGLLSLPFAISESGLILGIFFLLGGALAFGIYYMVLVEVCEKEKTFDYVELTSKLLGRTGRRVTELSVALLCFGAVVAYIVLISQMMLSVFVSFGIIESTDNEKLRIWIIFVMTAFVWFPFTIPKKITTLAYFSLLSLVAIAYIAIIVIVQFPAYAENFIEIEKLVLIKVDSSFLNSIGVIFFSFDAVQNVPILHYELQRRSKRRMGKIVWRSMGVLVLIYLALGVVGYLSYLGEVPEIIVFRPTIDGQEMEFDWPMVIARITVCIYLTIAIPLNFYALRHSMEQFLAGPDLEESDLRYYIVTILALLLADVVAILIPSALVFFDIVGGIFCSELVFIIPMILYWKIDVDFKKKVVVTIGTVFISALGFACAFNQIFSFIQQQLLQ